ncbi:MAG: nucleotidyltransferase domain-containing protein [Methanosarcinales archaeon]|uniref:Nucleotidyltransferase domain-containing protein n=1 Tax=Candidatus Ethanoperedens thermophilum TaxID=2766897 RepID=A0A848D8I8_9EURY|nr:nucleotidyltransferase domain-containing protein [Candidatus Ethanoperedens thermophilum]
MHTLRRIDIGKHEEILKEVEKFSDDLGERFNCEVYLYGSFARGDVHEGSDIDLIIVGDFKERFFDRIGKILDLTDLPIEPLVYTRDEFDAMKRDNLFVKSVLEGARRLV